MYCRRNYTVNQLSEFNGAGKDEKKINSKTLYPSKNYFLHFLLANLSSLFPFLNFAVNVIRGQP
jgi:hypothetical protein